MAISDPVNRIADRATNNHCRADFAPARKVIFHNTAPQIATDYQSQCQEEILLPTALVGQKTKRRAGIEYQRPIKKIRNDVYAFLILKIRQRPDFCDLVERNRC